LSEKMDVWKKIEELVQKELGK